MQHIIKELAQFLRIARAVALASSVVVVLLSQQIGHSIDYIYIISLKVFIFNRFLHPPPHVKRVRE